MDELIKGLGNYRTTILGFALGVLTYWGSVGAKLPSTPEEWFAFAVSSALAGFGVVAKDASTGSGPGARF